MKLKLISAIAIAAAAVSCSTSRDIISENARAGRRQYQNVDIKYLC